MRGATSGPPKPSVKTVRDQPSTEAKSCVTQCKLSGKQLETVVAEYFGRRLDAVARDERKIGHHAALRQLANRLVGILHGCLKTGSPYDKETAWQHHRTVTTDMAA